jgi:hypothetical protein
MFGFGLLPGAERVVGGTVFDTVLSDFGPSSIDGWLIDLARTGNARHRHRCNQVAGDDSPPKESARSIARSTVSWTRVFRDAPVAGQAAGIPEQAGDLVQENSADAVWGRSHCDDGSARDQRCPVPLGTGQVLRPKTRSRGQNPTPAVTSMTAPTTSRTMPPTEPRPKIRATATATASP